MSLLLPILFMTVSSLAAVDEAEPEDRNFVEIAGGVWGMTGDGRGLGGIASLRYLRRLRSPRVLVGGEVDATFPFCRHCAPFSVLRSGPVIEIEAAPRRWFRMWLGAFPYWFQTLEDYQGKALQGVGIEAKAGAELLAGNLGIGVEGNLGIASAGTTLGWSVVLPIHF